MLNRFAFLAAIAAASTCMAHDTWVETNTNLLRPGDGVFVDLKLGNHGNEHRDFKLASKVELKGCKLDVIAPSGSSYDILPELIDTGYTPKEGFWQAQFVGVEPGLYMVSHSFDQVMTYAPVRAIKSAKTFFVVSASLDRVPFKNPGFDRALGHAFELVPTANPVTPMGPGESIAVQLLYHGKPMPEAKISFIPRGTTLAEGFDQEYERTTDAEGRASFTPKAGNVYLVVAHHEEKGESGEGYESTKYAATLTVFVPTVCPCCE